MKKETKWTAIDYVYWTFVALTCFFAWGAWYAGSENAAQNALICAAVALIAYKISPEVIP